MLENKNLTAVFEEITRKINQKADNAGQKLEDFIRQEDAIRPVIVAAYSRLPMIVRMVLKEEAFVNFLLQHREKLLLHNQIQPLVAEIVNKFINLK